MKFKIHQPSYIQGLKDGMLSESIYLEGNTLELPADTKHVPGPHWEPLDDEARALAKQHSIKFTGQVPDCIDQFQKQLAEAMEREKKAGDPDKIGAAVVEALVKAGVIKAPKQTPVEV